MIFKMIRESVSHLWWQDNDSSNDEQRQQDHYDYVYLTDIPSSFGFDGVDYAFFNFALKVCENIEGFTSIREYFSEVQTVIDDKTGYCIFRFRFDLYDLDNEYEIDTESP